MKANELRLNNLLQDREGRLCRVEKIEDCKERQIYAPAIRGGMTSLPNKPIPITEEWLVKLGFEKNNLGYNEGFYYSYRLNNEIYCDLSIISFDKNEYVEACLFPYEKWFKCKYIHQLQNLIFALTGEELNL